MLSTGCEVPKKKKKKKQPPIFFLLSPSTRVHVVPSFSPSVHWAIPVTKKLENPCAVRYSRDSLSHPASHRTNDFFLNSLYIFFFFINSFLHPLNQLVSFQHVHYHLFIFKFFISTVVVSVTKMFIHKIQ